MRKIFITISVLSASLFWAQETKVATDTANVKSIEDVTLTKKVFQKKSDRFVFDVAQSPISKGSTAFNLLQETPMISATDGKTLKILGKNIAVIYINGRKSNMDAEAVLEMLKGMPAENISKIEVITVPSSEFQVEANEGIINIILKKKPTDGTNGNVRLQDTQNYHNQQSVSFTLNHRRDKLGVSANINASNQTRRQTYELYNGNLGFENSSIGSINDPNLNLGGYINLDYDINDKQSIGFSLNKRNNWSLHSEALLLNQLKNFSDNTVLNTQTYNLEDAKSSNNSYTLNYELKTDDLGSKFTVSASYLDYERIQENVNTTNLLDGNLNFVKIANQFNQKIPLYIDNYGVLVDYVQKFKKNTSISFGASYNKTKTDSNTEFFSVIPPTGLDTNQSNYFVYNEKIAGTYITLEKTFGEKWISKIGTRFENTNTEGNVLGKNIAIERNFNNLLPYFSLNYSPNDKNNFSYSFSSRVRRPSFWQINPARMYLTKTNYIQNNPFMLPEKYYNQELNYMWKNSYYINVNYSFVRDASEQIPLQGKNAAGEDVLAYIRTNYDQKQEMGVTLGMQKNLLKGIWMANNSITIGRNSFKGTVSKDPTDFNNSVTFQPFVLDKSSTYAQLQFNNTIRLSAKKDWFLGVSYFYLSPLQIEFGKLDGLQSLDLSLKKTLENWTFNLELDDIFNTNRANIYGRQSNGNYNTVLQNQYNRSISLSATYTFGNQKLKKTRKFEGANEEVKKRTGGN